MSVPGPILGPCTSWIAGADVAACCTAVTGPTDAIAGVVALEASMLLYEVSGRRFSGLCSRTVRPCRDACSCFGGSRAAGLSPYYWGGFGQGGYGVGAWGNEGGDRCGCGSLSKVRLAGYPVRVINSVKIDGVALPATDSKGNLNYRLDGWRDLVRMSDPGPPVNDRQWPACQNLALDDSKPGTFSITYQHGSDPPQLGRDAATQLACQLYKSCHGQACDIPVAATRVQRQGITVDRGLLVSWLDPKRPTGLLLVDAFLAGYWNSGPGRRQPAVFSPDVQPYARRVGP
jgi:hypothetical protein